MTDSPSGPASDNRASLLLATLVILGMVAAGWRAHTWPEMERSRNLIVVAPDGTNIRTIDGPTLIDETQGVHTWAVYPGPLTMEIDFVGHEPQRTTVVVPKGLGGLMLEVKADEAGKLVLAYF